jgi:hypothetical protein
MSARNRNLTTNQTSFRMVDPSTPARVFSDNNKTINALSIDGICLCDTIPVDGQVLQYKSVENLWCPTTLPVSSGIYYVTWTANQLTNGQFLLARDIAIGGPTTEGATISTPLNNYVTEDTVVSGGTASDAAEKNAFYNRLGGRITKVWIYVDNFAPGDTAKFELVIRENSGGGAEWYNISGNPINIFPVNIAGTNNGYKVIDFTVDPLSPVSITGPTNGPNITTTGDNGIAVPGITGSTAFLVRVSNLTGTPPTLAKFIISVDPTL